MGTVRHDHGLDRRPPSAASRILELDSLRGLACLTVLGNIGGPILAGLFADWTGSYRTGFTILAVLSAIGSLFFLLARRPR